MNKKNSMNKMNSFAKLSIVTVTYNCIKEIESTILSVINQDYPNFEYIIIDGGSIDGTVEIIKKYQDKVTYWVSEPDKGIYDAMNKGILKASGEWITMRNCGDYFAERDSLSKLFMDPIDSSVDFVCASAYRITPLGYYISSSKEISPNSKKMTIVHPATFVRTSWHKQMLFDLQYKVAADYNLIYKSKMMGRKFLIRDIPTVIFPQGGYSSVNWKNGKRDGQKVRGQYKTCIQKLNTECWILKLSFSHAFRNILKKIPSIKRKRDELLIKRLSIKPLPLPVEKFY